MQFYALAHIQQKLCFLAGTTNAGSMLFKPPRRRWVQGSIVFGKFAGCICVHCTSQILAREERSTLRGVYLLPFL
jgi:hypothetical protein